MAASIGTDVYTRLGVRPVINAQGNRTDLGGSATGPIVTRAMEEANHTYVEMRELLEKSGEFVVDELDAGTPRIRVAMEDDGTIGVHAHVLK